ncbi:Atypical chemokine receptor 3 [Sciurus carolinensis]|uniref:Atypical chemokine receptor 3 n=1 Tax=Sciurus carolinensis TaxID=30640 RepID=A0AA41MUU0_SCICA|nr:Atypical chemokine receptor 3 [Sciurus carolinensis]
MDELTCKVTHLIFSINLVGSIFFLTCMSVDRYLSITYFTSTSSHRKKIVCCILCVLVWLMAFCVSVPDTYYLKSITSASNNETYCWSFYHEHSIKKWLIMELVSVVLGFTIPFCIIGVLPNAHQSHHGVSTVCHTVPVIGALLCQSHAVQLHQLQLPIQADEGFVFKYSAKTGLSKVIDTSRVSETECLVLKQNTK